MSPNAGGAVTAWPLFVCNQGLIKGTGGSRGGCRSCFGYLEAGAVIAMVPCVLLYIGLQRFYIRGLMSGVVKG